MRNDRDTKEKHAEELAEMLRKILEAYLPEDPRIAHNHMLRAREICHRINKTWIPRHKARNG